MIISREKSWLKTLTLKYSLKTLTSWNHHYSHGSKYTLISKEFIKQFVALMWGYLRTLTSKFRHNLVSENSETSHLLKRRSQIKKLRKWILTTFYLNSGKDKDIHLQSLLTFLHDHVLDLMYLLRILYFQLIQLSKGKWI